VSWLIRVRKIRSRQWRVLGDRIIKRVCGWRKQQDVGDAEDEDVVVVVLVVVVVVVVVVIVVITIVVVVVAATAAAV